MSNRTFIVLGGGRQLVRELKEALPGARIIQTECLDHIFPLKEAQNARILVGQGTVRPCCKEKLDQWILESAPIHGEVRSFKPRRKTSPGHRSATDAWAERVRLMSGRCVNMKVDAFLATAKEHDHEWFTVQEAAQSLGLSVRHIRRLVEREVGYAPSVLLHLSRIESVAKEIERTGMPLSSIARSHHFPDLPTMTRQFKRFVGGPPSQYRRIVAATKGPKQTN
jgi:AraC-like DNA-binding protein